MFDESRLASIEKGKRSSYKSVTREMEVSKSTIGRWFKDRLIRAIANVIKPGYIQL